MDCRARVLPPSAMRACISPAASDMAFSPHLLGECVSRLLYAHARDGDVWRVKSTYVPPGGGAVQWPTNSNRQYAGISIKHGSPATSWKSAWSRPDDGPGRVVRACRHALLDAGTERERTDRRTSKSAGIHVCVAAKVMTHGIMESSICMPLDWLFGPSPSLPLRRLHALSRHASVGAAFRPRGVGFKAASPR